MDVQINTWAVILAAASSMVIGSIWYGKIGFMDTWMKLTKMVPKKGKELQNAMIVSMLTAVLASLVMAYVLAHVSYISNQYFHNSFMKDTIMTAFWMFVGFQGFRMLMNDTFEGRRKKLTLINIGNAFVTVMVMGIIIGAMGIK